jgi:hypothetical protein
VTHLPDHDGYVTIERMRQHRIVSERVDRWWATYNAALTGLLANPQSGTNWGLCHDNAHRVANHAHGALEAKP